MYIVRGGMNNGTDSALNDNAQGREFGIFFSFRLALANYEGVSEWCDGRAFLRRERLRVFVGTLF